MDITINGRGVTLSDRFRTVAEDKATKVESLASRALALEVKVTRENDHSVSGGGDDRVEVTLIGPGPVIRAEASAGDKFAALDVAFNKLIDRIRRAKDRTKVHGGHHRPRSIREASESGFSDFGLNAVSTDVLETVTTGAIPVQAAEDTADLGDDYSPVVIREKVFASQSMTVEEAVDHMELVGHDFFLFVDARSDRPAVVYRRKGWNYGVIELDDTI